MLGFVGHASAVMLDNLGGVYDTVKVGLRLMAMGAMRERHASTLDLLFSHAPTTIDLTIVKSLELAMKSSIPVVTLGAFATHRIIAIVILNSKMVKPDAWAMITA